MTSLDLLLSVAGAPVLFCAGYLLFFTLLSAQPPRPNLGSSKPRFRFLIPAHDESAGIASTVESLFAVDYPRERFDVLTIADNCSDDTAERARAAGAIVLERRNEHERGKGYALHYAFELLPEEIDAAVVIDADTVVSPNILHAFAARLERGAVAVQADYAVRDAKGTWRTRLMAIAFGAFHVVRSRARERLQVSAGLRGNGMCFTRAVLRAVPHEAYSIVEDVEYGIRLAEAGHRVFYADEAHVYGEMVSRAKAAQSQRERWEGGRMALAKKHGLRLIRKGLKGDAVLLDLGIDVLVPPLSRIAVPAVLGTVFAGTLAILVGGFRTSLVVFGSSTVFLAVYVLRGWGVSGVGPRGLLDLVFAPAYVLWKATLRRRPPAAKTPEWIRTTREPSRDESTKR